MNKKKGQSTRDTIVDRARQIFNEKGLNITLEKIAAEMGLTKSRITNHFSTKETLFLAILHAYEEKFAQLAAEISLENSLELADLAKSLSAIMDVQYDFRCGIAYLAMVTQSNSELHTHIGESYKRNIRNIQKRTERMVDAGILNPEILSKSNFETFVFQYTNILTTWVINLELYNAESGYAKMKPVYLDGALSCFKPYLSKRGEKQFSAIDFRQISKSGMKLKSKPSDSSP
ncbi:MAG: TetR/AcrR family transcriptional regulator [Ignavibacteria bacterium]|nr:TetR/AcrR family transcriptional regulator [Ignavibacteria bacterium]